MHVHMLEHSSGDPGTSVYCLIREYDSTFYIGIAMVVLPYFGPWQFYKLEKVYRDCIKNP